jgi:methanethiol S-methyltransferase
MTISFWIILVSVLAYGGLHSWLASLNLKGWTAKRFGDAFSRLYRLLYNLIAVITLLPVLMLPIILVDKNIYRIPWPWIAVTLTVQLMGLLTLLAGVIQTGVMKFLGVCQLVRCEGESEPALIVTGLYRWVRHPLYTAGLVFVWLMPWMTWNLLALNIGITIYIVFGAILEEKKLQQEFGAAYIEYRKKTPMLIPGLRLFG